MKHTHILSITILLLLNMNNYLFGYIWGFTNETDKPLVLKIKLYWDNSLYYGIVQPGDRASMDWSPPNWKAGYCLDKVQWAVYRPELAYHGGLDLITDHGVDNGKFHTLIKSDTNPSGYDLKTADLIFFPDDLYNETLQYAEDIGRGSDFVCLLSGKKAAKPQRKPSKVFEPVIQNAINKLQKLRLHDVQELLSDTYILQQKWIDSGVSLENLNILRNNLQKIIKSTNYKLSSSGSLPVSDVDEEAYARILNRVLIENEKVITEKAIYVIDTLLSLGTALEFERTYPEGGCKGVFSDVIAWLGGFIAKSSCRSREFQIWKRETDGEIIFSTSAQ